MDIYLSQKAQITSLKTDKAPDSVLSEYFNFINIFSKDLTAKLAEYIRINIHIINLIEGHQLRYRSIYSLGLVELKILKTYIKINLAKGFIRLSKSSTSTLNFFVKKLHRRF